PGELQRVERVGLDQLPGRPARQRNLGDRGAGVSVEDEDGELSRARDRQQVGARERQRRRFDGIETRREDLRWLSRPGRGREGGLAVRRKGRVAGRSAVEGEGPVRRRAGGRLTQSEGGDRRAEDETRDAQEKAGPRGPLGRRDRDRGPRQAAI